MTDTPPKPEKTYKRELATLALFVLWGFYGWGVIAPQATLAANALLLPTFAVVGAAFGFDAWTKQSGDKK